MALCPEQAFYLLLIFSYHFPRPVSSLSLPGHHPRIWARVSLPLFSYSPLTLPSPLLHPHAASYPPFLSSCSVDTLSTVFLSLHTTNPLSEQKTLWLKCWLGSWACGHAPVILALKKLRRERNELETTLSMDLSHKTPPVHHQNKGTQENKQRSKPSTGPTSLSLQRQLFLCARPCCQGNPVSTSALYRQCRLRSGWN